MKSTIQSALFSSIRDNWVLLFRMAFVVLLLASFALSVQNQNPASLEVEILDEADRPTPVRVRITNNRGVSLFSEEDAVTLSPQAAGIPEAAVAVMYGRNDRAEGFALQPDGAFYVDGSFTISLAPGTYHLQASKGYEYLPLNQEISLSSGEKKRVTVRLERWINMPEQGWFSSDDHIHLRRSPREDPLILRWLAAEDVHVGNLLQMGDLFATYYSQYAFGPAGVYQEGNYVLTSGQEEPRTPEIGHTISLLADGFVRHSGEYYFYDRVFDEIESLGGISGYAHQAMSFHGYRGMALDVPRQKIDFIELLQYCVAGGPLHLEHYYHFLDLGFPLIATAGSDFPWCGRGPRFNLESGCSQIGDARFYTYVGPEFSFEDWKSGLKSGHTFVTSGPMLLFRVNDRLPGDTLDVRTGDSVRVTAEALGNDVIPLKNLEIVVHGEVVESVHADGEQDGDRLFIDTQLQVKNGIWIAARAEAGPTQVAHTTPVYISVEGGGFHNQDRLRERLDQSEMYLKELEQVLQSPGEQINEQAFRYREGLFKRIAQVRKILSDLRQQ